MSLSTACSATPAACPSRHGCGACPVRLVSPCAALPGEEIAAAEALRGETFYAPRSMLFEQDDPAESVFTITEGVVRLYRLLPDGRRQVLGFGLPGDSLGLCLLERHGMSAEAVGEVRACRFARRDYQRLAEAKPHLLRRLHELAGHELAHAHEHMVVLGRRNAEERLACFLLGLRDRLRRTGHVSVTLPLAMSRTDIADHLGLTIETVSRTLTKLAKAKAILVVPDGVRLTDVPRLEELAAV